MKIIGIKSKDGFYVTNFTGGTYEPYSSLSGFLVNGSSTEDTLHEGWCKTEKEPETIQQYVSQPDINHRYELIDKSMCSKKTPLVFKRDEVAVYDKHEYFWGWLDKYKMYSSLYELKFDKQDRILEDVGFEYETLIEVDELKSKTKISYEVYKTNYKSDGTRKLTEKDVRFQLIDKIRFPEPILQEKKCKFSPQETFDIVRFYIQQNINPKLAKIKSDYDFCFSVEKIIPLSKKETYTVDVNNNIFQKRKRKPKIEIRYKTERGVVVFEMTAQHYNKYPQIKGFEAENTEKLKEKIDSYCEQLIGLINEPVKECDKCNGRGVVVNEKS